MRKTAWKTVGRKKGEQMKLSDKLVNWGREHPFCWSVLIPGILILCWILLGILGGCATTPSRINWTKPNMSHEEYWSDRRACDNQAASISYRSKGSSLNELGIKYGFGDILHKRYYDECMQEKGYTHSSQ